MNNQFYTIEKLSERIEETPEGFLLCRDVPIARAGRLAYKAGEIKTNDGLPISDAPMIVERDPAELQKSETVSSALGKPLSVIHPKEFITPETWKRDSSGTVLNVRPGTGKDADKLIADLLVQDAQAIEKVKNKELRQVSCGYNAKYMQDDAGNWKQTDIKINHVALVPQGRCGAECAIFDHAPPQTLEEKLMSWKDALLKAFGKAMDEMPEDLTKEQPAKTQDADTGATAAALADAAKELATLVQTLKQPATTQPSTDAQTPEQAPADAEVLSQVLAAVKQLIDMLKAQEPATEDKKPAATTDAKPDDETIARAEILAPGIAVDANIKKNALDAVCKTKDGKEIVDKLLAGKTMDAVDQDMLFNATAEMLKVKRSGQLPVTSKTTDGKPGVMAPEQVNKIFGRKS